MTSPELEFALQILHTQHTLCHSLCFSFFFFLLSLTLSQSHPFFLLLLFLFLFISHTLSLLYITSLETQHPMVVTFQVTQKLIDSHQRLACPPIPLSELTLSFLMKFPPFSCSDDFLADHDGSGSIKLTGAILEIV